MISDFVMLKEKLKKYYEKDFDKNARKEKDNQETETPIAQKSDSKQRYELHCFTKHPVMNNEGVPVLVWLVRDT
jgi:hypothetical protein